MTTKFEKYTAVEIKDSGSRGCSLGWTLVKKVQDAGEGRKLAIELARKYAYEAKHAKDFNVVDEIRVKKYGYKKDVVTFSFSVSNHINTFFQNILLNKDVSHLEI